MGSMLKKLADPLHLFSSPDTPAPPPIAPPTVMPIPDDKAVTDAKRRKIAQVQATSGRVSTIFNDANSNPLGG